jgi:hypothetical protein
MFFFFYFPEEGFFLTVANMFFLTKNILLLNGITASVLI